MKESFSERLKKALSIKNISQAELVERTGITKGAISQYVKGEYTPKQINTYKIAKALDVNEAWLMGHDVSMERYYNIQEGGGKTPKETVLLLREFRKLNSNGKQEAIKRVEELTYIDKYTSNSKIYEIRNDYELKVAETPAQYPDHLQLNAAHEIEGASKKDKQHDEDIMNDENF